MPAFGPPIVGDIGSSSVVRGGAPRPTSSRGAFGDPIPAFPLPLRRGEEEPVVDLGRVLHALYDRAGYDLRVDYGTDPVPPFSNTDAEWATALLRERGPGR